MIVIGIKYLVASLWLSPVFPWLDARSRFQNYKQVKDLMYSHECRMRIVKPFTTTGCQQSAVFAAAQERGLRTGCKAYFRKLGCR